MIRSPVWRRLVSTILGVDSVSRIRAYAHPSYSVVKHEDMFSQFVGLHTALSPNACVAVSLDDQHLASLSCMQFEDEHGSDQLDEGLYPPYKSLAPTDVHSETRSYRRSLRDAVFGSFT